MYFPAGIRKGGKGAFSSWCVAMWLLALEGQAAGKDEGKVQDVKGCKCESSAQHHELTLNLRFTSRFTSQLVGKDI